MSRTKWSALDSKNHSPRLLGDVAQVGERLPCKQEVGGSTPLISTIAKPLLLFKQRSQEQRSLTIELTGKRLQYSVVKFLRVCGGCLGISRR